MWFSASYGMTNVKHVCAYNASWTPFIDSVSSSSSDDENCMQKSNNTIHDRKMKEEAQVLIELSRVKPLEEKEIRTRDAITR